MKVACVRALALLLPAPFARAAPAAAAPAATSIPSTHYPVALSGPSRNHDPVNAYRSGAGQPGCGIPGPRMDGERG